MSDEGHQDRDPPFREERSTLWWPDVAIPDHCLPGVRTGLAQLADHVAIVRAALVAHRSEREA